MGRGGSSTAGVNWSSLVQSVRWPVLPVAPLLSLPSLLPWSLSPFPPPALPSAWLPPDLLQLLLRVPAFPAALHVEQPGSIRLLTPSSPAPGSHARCSWQGELSVGWLSGTPNGSARCRRTRRQEDGDPLGDAQCRLWEVAGLTPTPAAPRCTGQNGSWEVPGAPWCLLSAAGCSAGPCCCRLGILGRSRCCNIPFHL